jgi:Tol biopolymer transport system component
MEQWPSDWSRDGASILFDEPRESTRRDIAVVHVADRRVETLVASAGDDTAARFSPDGQWIAFQSNVSGSDEVYVRRTRGDEERLLLSAGGGSRPRWMPDGRKVVYFVERAIGGARSVLVKSVALDLQGPRPLAAAPEVVMEIPPPVVTGQFDLHPDGTRVLVLRPDDARAAVGAPRVHVTLSWFVAREAARTRTAPQ